MTLKNFSACLFFTLLIIPLLNAYADPLEVSTDKPEYRRGDVLNIFISASPNCNLGVQVANPVGGVEFVDQVRTDDKGRTSTSFRVSTDALYGTYIVYVAGCGDSGSCTFKVAEVIPVSEFPVSPGVIVSTGLLAVLLLPRRKDSDKRGE
ncbi:MAG: hypothetical protein FGF50_09675 [Candidatus Brockarchaeota archaeon]|nr:hypothetical protein [Candidatus Brockarchaeota archaeon]